MSKWQKGVSGNLKGRPKTAFRDSFDHLLEKKKMMDLGTQILANEWNSIIEAMVGHAIEGNVQAAVFLRDTFLGKPKEVISVDPDGEMKNVIKITVEESKL